jgi:phenylalanyl-tRNA synthetase beta chain
LSFTCTKTSDGWDVIVPARRSDMTLEVDLIEEIIRLYGYDQLPLQLANAGLQIHPASEDKLTLQKLRRICCDLGYHEVITYSFVDKNLQHQLNPDFKPKELVNPMTADMAVMRTNLWPGLVNTYLYNQHRQQPRVRIFEMGLRFIQNDTFELSQQRVLSGLVSGIAFPEQWGAPARDTDFFDVKGDIEKLLQLTTSMRGITFKAGIHPALHPGQTVEIYRDSDLVGLMGALHPQVKQTLGITENVLVFELLLDPLETFSAVQYREFSKFPEIRRDIAIFLDQSIPSQAIQDTIAEVGGELLRNVTLFDVYQGKGIAPHQKSIALALTLQHDSRTLVDEEVTAVVENIIAVLKQRFAAELRG